MSIAPKIIEQSRPETVGEMIANWRVGGINWKLPSRGGSIRAAFKHLDRDTPVGKWADHFLDDPASDCAVYVARRVSEESQPTRIYHMPTDKIDRIIHSVTRATMITREEMEGSSRKAHIVRARHIAFKLMRDKTKLSYISIGGYFNHRDHSTVVHGVNSINHQMNYCPIIQSIMKRIG